MLWEGRGGEMTNPDLILKKFDKKILYDYLIIYMIFIILKSILEKYCMKQRMMNVK